MNQQKIGSFLKTLRKEKGITQEQAAEQFGVAGRTISRWETGSNMPDLSLLIEISSFYGVEVGEILDGKRKSENMNDEIRTTLEKVADYNNAMNAKAADVGVIVMSCACIILILISMYKEISPAPLLSMVCAYNGASFLYKAKQTKDKVDVFTAAIFLLAMLINTITFIIK